MTKLRDHEWEIFQSFEDSIHPLLSCIEIDDAVNGLSAAQSRIDRFVQNPSITRNLVAAASDELRQARNSISLLQVKLAFLSGELVRCIKNLCEAQDSYSMMSRKHKDGYCRLDDLLIKRLRAPRKAKIKVSARAIIPRTGQIIEVLEKIHDHLVSFSDELLTISDNAIVSVDDLDGITLLGRMEELNLSAQKVLFDCSAEGPVSQSLSIIRDLAWELVAIDGA